MLTRLRINQLRGVRDLSFNLSGLKVLVGKNGAGKSTILGGLSVIHQYAAKGQEALPEIAAAIGLKPRQVVRAPRIVSIEVEGLVLDSKGKERPYVYGLTLGSQFGSFLQPVQEFFRFTDSSDSKPLLEFPGTPNSGMIQIYNEEGAQSMGLGLGGQSALATVALSQQEEGSALGRFAREVLAWQSFTSIPTAARGVTPAKRETRLEEFGENLSTVLHSIHAEDPESFKRIIDAVKIAVPEIESVQVPITAEGETYVQVREKGVASPLPIAALSDGTIAMLELFTVLEGPRAPLLLVEEPENYVHPGLMELVAASLHHAAKSTQVLVATHSPFLLNHLEPDEVIVIEKSDGKVSATPVSNKVGIAEAAKQLTLGELWTSGAIGGVP